MLPEGMRGFHTCHFEPRRSEKSFTWSHKRFLLANARQNDMFYTLYRVSM